MAACQCVPFSAVDIACVGPMSCARTLQITTYECSSETFVRHHGEAAARAYLKAAREGIRYQTVRGALLLCLFSLCLLTAFAHADAPSVRSVACRLSLAHRSWARPS